MSKIMKIYFKRLSDFQGISENVMLHLIVEFEGGQKVRF